MFTEDDYLSELCEGVLTVKSIFIHSIVCDKCNKGYHFADGTFGIFENKALTCCPYCDSFFIVKCNITEESRRRNLYWR